MRPNSKLFENFYMTRRMALGCSDGGGPFGFDIHKALEVCYLIDKYNCDEIIETGTNTGDTTEFLAKQYPDKKIISCEVNKEYIDIAANRLSKYENVTLHWESSEKVLKKINSKLPFYYLDAHWEEYWPLVDELKTIRNGIVCVDDFDIGVAGFSCDEYNSIRINRKLINDTIDVELYTNNSDALYPYPRLQRYRISGRGYFRINVEDNHFTSNNWFKRH